MEIIEHVDNLDNFLETIISLLNKNGLLFISSIEKNLLSYITTILFAEKILKIIPDNTHTYEKFIDAEELIKKLNKKNLDLLDQKYYFYDPLNNEMWENNMTKVNYIVAFKNN